MYLLDTNVVSEIRKARPHGAVFAWLAAVPEAQVFISAVTIGEIQAGIELTREQDAARADALEAWLARVCDTWQVLAADAAVFRAWARMKHRKAAHHLEDTLIAATASVHQLTVVTRNTKDFQALGVALLNPFDKVQRA